MLELSQNNSSEMNRSGILLHSKGDQMLIVNIMVFYFTSSMVPYHMHKNEVGPV